MPGPSITGSVADLFATLGLDVGPLTASLAESKAMIREAGADMSLSLGALQSRYQQVVNSLTSNTEATTAYQAALQSLGIQTGSNTQLTAAQVASLGRERDALEQLISAEQAALEIKLRADQEKLGAIQAAAVEHQLANQRIADLNQIAIGEAKASAINAATVEERLAFNNLVAQGEARAVAIAAESASAQVAFANQIAQGEARAAAISQAAADVKIATLNQVAAGEARAAAIAQAAADAKVASANQVALGEARAEAMRLEALAAEQVLADERIALANQIAIGTARAEAMQTEATAAAVAERIKLANQYAEAEVRAAAIVKEAQAADAIPLRMGANLSAGGIRPTVGSGAGGMIAGAAAAFVGYESIKAFAEFDDALNKSFSIMKDITDFQKNEMKRTAQDLSTQYGISAAEIAKGFYFLQSAGRTTEEALKELPAVVQFAFVASADGVMKVSTAAETLTSVFNAMKGSGQSIEHISDLLVKADSIAQGTAEQFGKAFAGKGAGAFQILGKSAEEALALLSVMAQVGIPAAQQQTALIQILRDLPKEAEAHSKALITLNGHTMTYRELLYDSTGQMKNFADILQEFAVLFNGASTATIQQDLAMLHLNSRTNQTMQSIFSMSGPMKEYQKQYENVAGATKKVADIRLESAATQFKQLGAAAKLAAIDMGEALAPAAGFVASKLKETIVTVHDLTQGFIGLAKAAYEYYIQGKNPSAPKPPPGPAANVPGVSGSGSVFDPDADAKAKAAAERAAQERNRIQNIRLDSARKAEEDLVELEINSIKHQADLHKISAEDAEAQLQAQYRKQLDIAQKYELQKLALETTKKSPVYEAQVEASMSAKISREAALEQQAAFTRENREAKELAQRVKAYDDYQKNLTAGFADFDRDEAKHNQDITNDKIKALQEQEAAEARHAVNVLELERTMAAFKRQTGMISANEQLAIDAQIDAAEDALQRKSVQRQLDLLELKGSGDVRYASTKAALEAQLDQLSDKRQMRELKTAIQIIKAGEAEIQQMQAKVKWEREYGDGVVSVSERVIRLKKAEEELHILRGQSNSMEMIQIEMLIIRNQAMIDKQHELGLMFVDVAHKMGKLWDDFGDKVAEGILAGGKFWKFWHDMIHQFEVDMLKTLIHGVLKTLKDNLLAIPGVSSTIGKVFGLGSGPGAGAGQQAASLTQQTTAITTNTTAITANTTAETANTAAITTLTAVLTGNTVATVADAAATTANAVVTAIHTTTQIATTATEVSSRLITDGIEMAGNIAETTNTGAVIANTAAVAADAAATSAAAGVNAATGVANAAGGVASGVAGAAGNMAASSIVGMVTGAITAVSSVIGNFQMAGMNKTLDLIENYTRYLKIGLVEQGDSLLNDSHTIRNTLTDFMAYNWGVQASYLQQICEKLDALIGGGGISGVTVQPKMAMAGGGTEDILTDAGAGLSNDNSVTIDLSGSTFNGEATPQQVDAIFNKGIDRAKRSGAFRPGTWPR